MPHHVRDQQRRSRGGPPEEGRRSRSEGGGGQEAHEILLLGNEEQHLIFTVDSGASENVIPQLPTRPSAGSQHRSVYTAASGATIPNKG